MKYFILVAVVIINFTFSFSQEILIKAANSGGKVALLSLSGEKTSFIDSIPVSNNIYKFNLSNNHLGFYRLIFNNKKWIDFVYDTEDVEIETDANNILDSLRVIKSESNKIYYEFIKLNKAYKTKSELLQLIFARYPKDDDYYQTTKEKLIQIQKEYLNFVNAASQVNSNSLK